MEAVFHSRWIILFYL